MASHYVHEDNRKHRYTTRACVYLIKRITEPMDISDRQYKSIRDMATELKISDPAIRKFVKSHAESTYIRSKDTGVLYLLKRPIRDLAISARCIEYSVDGTETQDFTSLYQLVKRFRVSYNTVLEMKKMQPLGKECTKTITDEFKRKHLLTFYK